MKYKKNKEREKKIKKETEKEMERYIGRPKDESNPKKVVALYLLTPLKRHFFGLILNEMTPNNRK